MALPPNQAFGASYTLALPASTTDVAAATIGLGSGLRPAVVIILRAAKGNASTDVTWGFGSSQQPLSAGEAVAIDIPAGTWVDLQELHFAGNGTAGQIVYVTAVILRG